MTKDLTEGKPWRLIIGFAFPLFLGMLFQQFYSLVDTIVVGKFLGSNALAQVGSTGSINFLIIGFCNGVCSGFAIPVARAFGAKEYSSMRKVVAHSAWLSGIFAVVMTIITVLFCRQILEIMNTPKDIIDGAYQYIVIIFAGIPVTYLYNMLSGIIRSVGDSKTPVIFLALASVINIILDILLIGVLHTGVGGAGIATVISQAISGVACLIYMSKKYEILRISKEEWKWDTQIAKLLCMDGIPMGLQYSITAVGSVILQTAVNSLGTTAVASITAASRVSMFFCTPFDALGSTMATYGGQNIGAGKIDRIGEGLKAANIMGFIYSILAFLFLSQFSSVVLLLFVDATETEIIRAAQMCIMFNSGTYILLTMVNVVRFMIQGIGFSQFAVLAGVFEMIARTLVGIFLVPRLGFVGACLANPLAWVFADAFLIPAYYRCIKICKKNQEVSNKQVLSIG